VDLDSLDLDPNERILLVGLPPLAVIHRLAGRLENGIVVVLGDGEQIYALRRELAGEENVLVTPGSAEDIPWKDEFFSIVIDARGPQAHSAAAGREMVRVLAAGGRLLRDGALILKPDPSPSA